MDRSDDSDGPRRGREADEHDIADDPPPQHPGGRRRRTGGGVPAAARRKPAQLAPVAPRAHVDGLSASDLALVHAASDAEDDDDNGDGAEHKDGNDWYREQSVSLRGLRQRTITAAASVAGAPRPRGAAAGAAEHDGEDEIEFNRRASAVMAATAAIAGSGEDAADTVADDFVPFDPMNLTEPRIDSLPIEQQELERAANRMVPPFCAFCAVTHQRGPSSSDTPLAPSPLETLLAYAMNNIHRVDRSELCLKIQRRYLKYIVPLMAMEDDGGQSESKAPASAPAAASAWDAPPRAGAEAAGRRYMSLRTIAHHFIYHSPSARLVLENNLKALVFQSTYLVSKSMFCHSLSTGAERPNTALWKTYRDTVALQHKTLAQLELLRPDSGL